MCRSCKKKCDDITKHLMTEHKFSKETIESQLKTNPNSYKNVFEKLEQSDLRIKNLRGSLKIQEQEIYSLMSVTMLKEDIMFKKLPITDFEKSQIMGFKKWLTELKNRFNS